jgi:RNA polymerase sigma-70 factor (ECF subfamily)
VSDALVERARSGDVDAFVELIARREKSMVRIANAILGNEADSADALQDALESTWRQLPSLRDVNRFDAWSDRILVNACRLALRRRSRSRVRQIPLSDEVGGDGDRPSLEDRVAGRAALDRAFTRLDADDRAILVLHHLEGQPIQNVADVLAIPAGTVKSRLHSARRALERSLLEEER